MMKSSEKLLAVGVRISKELYKKVTQGDEKNKSLEFRRCIKISFILFDLFNEIAEDNPEIFNKYYNKLSIDKQAELYSFVKRYPKKERG